MDVFWARLSLPFVREQCTCSPFDLGPQPPVITIRHIEALVHTRPSKSELLCTCSLHFSSSSTRLPRLRTTEVWGAIGEPGRSRIHTKDRIHFLGKRLTSTSRKPRGFGFVCSRRSSPGNDQGYLNQPVRRTREHCQPRLIPAPSLTSIASTVLDTNQEFLIEGVGWNLEDD